MSGNSSPCRLRPSFAAIIPLGPAPIDLWRGSELVKSLTYCEPDIASCVFLDDAPSARGLHELVVLPATCRTISLPRQLHGRGAWNQGNGSWLGRLTAGIVKALGWICENSDVDFVLRIDADALVIAPFVESIVHCLRQTPDAGVIGALGQSCNPAIRALQDMRAESRLYSALQRWPFHSEVRQGSSVEVPGFGHISWLLLSTFDLVRPHVERAIAQGYRTNHYVQGGACVITRALMNRMAQHDYFNKPDSWEGLPFPDDVVLAMYSYAVGLRVCDCSERGQPFGVQHRGLAYSPAELVERGYRIIHSVRNDRHYSEYDIRQYFRQGP